MAHAATMNREIFRALTDSGMDEQYATRVAEAIPPADSIATKADLADLRAAIPDRENFAAGKDVAVLQTRVTTVEAAIIRMDETFIRINENFERIDKKFERIDKKFERIDERFERIDKRLDHLEKRADVTDEKISSIRTLLFAIYTPLLLLILASQFGILTRGILWHVQP